MPNAQQIIAQLIYWIMRLIWFIAPKKFNNIQAIAQFQDKPVVLCSWHDGIIFLPFMWRMQGYPPLAFMASTHKDGLVVANYMRIFGLVAALGSNKRDGAKALLQLIRYSKEENYWILLTPDGPKGPRHELQEGILYLPQKLSLPLVAIRVDYRGFTINKSWDKIKFPYPFAPITFTFGVLPADEINSEKLKILLGDY